MNQRLQKRHESIIINFWIAYTTVIMIILKKNLFKKHLLRHIIVLCKNNTIKTHYKYKYLIIFQCHQKM